MPVVAAGQSFGQFLESSLMMTNLWFLGFSCLLGLALNPFLIPTSSSAANPLWGTSSPGRQEADDFVIPKLTAEQLSRPYPRITITPVEMARLRTSMADDNKVVQRILQAKIKEADKALQQPLRFPPRGGQHNQWYQCEECQLALQTQSNGLHRCPKCHREYQGEPYDDVIFGRVHHANLKAALAASWAHVLTGDLKYAQFARRVLLGYAQRYREYPYHTSRQERDPRRKPAGGHLFEQTLTEASALATYIAPAFDLTCASGALTPAEIESIESGLLRPMLANIGKYKVGKSNWQTWHNAAMLAGGGVLADPSWIQRALTDRKHGFLDQMKVSVSADGMWYENSWAYHFYTLRALIQIAEYGRRLGIDVWSHPRLRSMFTIGPAYSLPGGGLPRFGDDVNSRLSSVRSSLEYYYHASSDATVEAYLSAWPTWDSILLGRKTSLVASLPQAESRLFPAAGHAILRTPGKKQLNSVMTFGPYGGFHGHFDKLSFVFFGLGAELGVDPGRARSQAYRLPVHQDWYKATISHNAVVVDEQSQQPASGKLLLFETRADYSLVAAECNQAYPGVEHRRLLFQTDKYLLVFDRLKSNQPRRFDWFYHNRGQAVHCDVETKDASLKPDFAGLSYIQRARTGSSDRGVRVDFEMPSRRVILRLDSAEKTGIMIGDGVGSSVLERVPLVRFTRQGKEACFAATLEPINADDAPEIETVAWSRLRDGSIQIQIKGAEASEMILLSPDWKQVKWKQVP